MEEKKRVRKFGNPFFRFVFSRSMITFLMLLIQIGYLVAGYLMLGEYMNVVTEITTVVVAVLVVYLINNDESDAYKIAWIVLFLVLPVFGVFLYFFVIWNIGHRWVEDSMKHTISGTSKFMVQEPEVEEAFEQENIYASQLAKYIMRTEYLPTYSGNRVSYFKNGAEKKAELLRQLEKAEDFIFMEYFIIDLGSFWGDVLEVLKKKAAEGVEVRVMYDGMCSLILLPYSYPKRLESMGIKARMYAPIRPLLSTHQNNRDHRKTVVIDGKVAFNGGINIGDEYSNEKEVFGYWKDCAVMIEGDAVRSYTAMFLQTWNALRDPRTEDYGKYINATKITDGISNGYVLPYCDGPYQNENVAENVYLHIINTAKHYVHIMTPYLILDRELLQALKYAAKRGVEVKILLPHIPDKKIVFAIARTYYPELLEAGVSMYEFTPGFVHAKVFVSDDRCAVVGSINLDFRSLYLHFENATFLYGNEVITEIEQDYVDTIAVSQKIEETDYKKFSLLQRATGRIFRIFGPLM